MQIQEKKPQPITPPANLLIAGGTGLIGSELGKKLARKGYKLFVLTRHPQRSLNNTPYPHEPLSWKQLDSPDAKDIFRSLDGIINLTGAGIADKRWTKKYKNILWRSRLKSTKKLVAACHNYPNRIRCFLSASATGYYGNCIEPALEGNQKGVGFLPELCWNWEQAVHKLSTRWVILRIGPVFSKKGGLLQHISPLIQMGLGGPIAGGNQLVSWIDMEDLTEMFLFALEENISGVFNAVAPVPLSNRKLTEALAHHFHTKARLALPKALIRLLFGEMAELLTNNQNVTCTKIQQAGFQFENPDWRDSLKAQLPNLKKTEKQLVFEQWLPWNKETLFSFFSDIKNIKHISPSFLKLQILSGSNKRINSEALVKFKFRIYKCPLYWTARISSWNPPNHFTDKQKKGPFLKWTHKHSFESLGQGTLITDRINYIPPMGIFGWLAAGGILNKIIRQIFNYRREMLAKITKKYS